MSVGMRPIPGIDLLPSSGPAPRVRDGVTPFMEVLAERLAQVNESQQKTKEMISDYLMGGQTSIEDLVVQMQKARTEVQLAVAVQNKAVQFYQELSRLQV